MKTKYERPYLSTKQAAQEWDVKPNEVAKYCRTNKITKAYKDAGQWYIPMGTIKPLTNQELKTAIIDILKIHNHLVVGHDILHDHSYDHELLEKMLVYLEEQGYIQLVDKNYQIDKVLLTNKGYNSLGNRVLIEIKQSDAIDIFTSLTKLVIVLTKYNGGYMKPSMNYIYVIEDLQEDHYLVEDAVMRDDNIESIIELADSNKVHEKNNYVIQSVDKLEIDTVYKGNLTFDRNHDFKPNQFDLDSNLDIEK